MNYGQAIEAMKRGGMVGRLASSHRSVYLAHRDTPMQYFAYDDGMPFSPSVDDQLSNGWYHTGGIVAANDNYSTLRAANVARQKEWGDGNQISGPLGRLWRSNELSGECGEATNVVKRLVREELGIRGSRDTVEHLAEELADVVICADLLAEEYGIDLEAAVRSKINATSEKVGLRTRMVAA